MLFHFKLSQQTFICCMKRWEICSESKLQTPERPHWRHSGVFFISFWHISHLFLVFLFFTLNTLLFAKVASSSYAPIVRNFETLTIYCAAVINNKSSCPNVVFYKPVLKTFLKFRGVFRTMSDILTHLFPMHSFSTSWKPYGFLMFSGDRERVQWEQMG